MRPKEAGLGVVGVRTYDRDAAMDCRASDDGVRIGGEPGGELCGIQHRKGSDDHEIETNECRRQLNAHIIPSQHISRTDHLNLFPIQRHRAQFRVLDRCLFELLYFV
jgi:hypothetical protein